jgi:hypothetical protein
MTIVTFPTIEFGGLGMRDKLTSDSWCGATAPPSGNHLGPVAVASAATPSDS